MTQLLLDLPGASYPRKKRSRKSRRLVWQEKAILAVLDYEQPIGADEVFRRLSALRKGVTRRDVRQLLPGLQWLGIIGNRGIGWYRLKRSQPAPQPSVFPR